MWRTNEEYEDDGAPELPTLSAGINVEMLSSQMAADDQWPQRRRCRGCLFIAKPDGGWCCKRCYYGDGHGDHCTKQPFEPTPEAEVPAAAVVPMELDIEAQYIVG